MEVEQAEVVGRQPVLLEEHWIHELFEELVRVTATLLRPGADRNRLAGRAHKGSSYALL